MGINYKAIEALIKEEQVTSGGSFVAGVALEEYLNKLKSKAEFITHYAEGNCETDGALRTQLNLLM